MKGAPDPERLVRLAWLNVLVHVAGLGAAALFLRPGTPAVELRLRMAYLVRGAPLWSAGWLLWMLCAVALVAFVGALADALGDERAARRAIAFAIAGAAVDLLCDATYLRVLPLIARQGGDHQLLFLTVERIANLGGTIVGNGFYSVAALVLAGAMRGRAGMALATALGRGVFLTGMLMVGAGYIGDPRLLELVTGPTIGLYCAWTLVSAYGLRRLSATETV